MDFTQIGPLSEHALMKYVCVCVGYVFTHTHTHTHTHTLSHTVCLYTGMLHK